MAEVSIMHHDDVVSSDEFAVRRLLDLTFDGRFDEHDWEHTLGGRHVIVRGAGGIVAHGAVVPRTIWIGPDEHAVGYVEAVATTPAVQGRGFGTMVMYALADRIRGQGLLGVLSTGEWHFYERLGWQRWEGPTWVRRSTGRGVRTPDEDDGVMVLTTEPIDLRSTITCPERAGDDW